MLFFKSIALLKMYHSSFRKTKNTASWTETFFISSQFRINNPAGYCYCLQIIWCHIWRTVNSDIRSHVPEHNGLSTIITFICILIKNYRYQIIKEKKIQNYSNVKSKRIFKLHEKEERKWKWYSSRMFQHI